MLNRLGNKVLRCFELVGLRLATDDGIRTERLYLNTLPSSPRAWLALTWSRPSPLGPQLASEAGGQQAEKARRESPLLFSRLPPFTWQCMIVKPLGPADHDEQAPTCCACKHALANQRQVNLYLNRATLARQPADQIKPDQAAPAWLGSARPTQPDKRASRPGWRVHLRRLELDQQGQTRATQDWRSL